jgi:phosphate transport system permease protein
MAAVAAASQTINHMAVAASMAVEDRSAQALMAQPSRLGDKAFEWLTLAMALAVVVLVILIGWQLAIGSSLAIKKFGFHFLTTSTWDPVAEQFGALPFIYGTLVSSVIALLIAVPLSIATAAYLTELAPLWIRQPLVSLIEMLAAIPSVILGLWGIFVMIPWLRDYPFPVLKRFLGWTPFFTGPMYGPSMLAGGIIIAIMILPIITSVSREILRSVPNLQREAAYALGATRWEVTRIAVLSYAKKGLFGAVILGLGRALGETMAVTMVIGNTPQIAASLFQPGYTLASVLANEFTEATTDMYLQALFEIGFVLFGLTILVNLLAQLLLRTITTASATRAVQ